MRRRELRIDRNRLRQRVDSVVHSPLGEAGRAEVVPGGRGVRRDGENASEQRFGIASATHARVGLAERIGRLHI